MVALQHVCQYATAYICIRLYVAQPTSFKVIAFLANVPFAAQCAKQVIHLYLGAMPYLKVKVQTCIISVSFFKVTLQASACNPRLGIAQTLCWRIAVNLIGRDKVVVTSIGLLCTSRKNKSKSVVKETIAHQYISLNIADVLDLVVVSRLSRHI